VTDLNPTDQSSIQNDMDNNQTQYVTYGFPLYAIQLKEDNGESVYSTPVKNDQLNKKTVYEVVV
jgi:hypothetical protein